MMVNRSFVRAAFGKVLYAVLTIAVAASGFDGGARTEIRHRDNPGHHQRGWRDYGAVSLEEDIMLQEVHDRFMEEVDAVKERPDYLEGVRELTEEELEEEKACDECEYLAILVMAEAGNQDLTGKRMVADVVLNRIDDPDFPDTITEVIEQPGQFATYTNGVLEYIEPTAECFEAVRMEMETRSWPGLLYFSSEGFLPYGTEWKKVGDHYFSTK